MQRLELFPFGNVPKAGGLELVVYKNDIAARRSDLYFFLCVAVTFGLLSFIPYMPPVIHLLYLAVAAASSLGASVTFVRLSRQSLRRALPEGASARTAELEDALHKRMREWNAEATTWNARFNAWMDEVTLWKRVRLRPNEDDFEWTPQSLEDRRKSLVSEETVLGFDRLALTRRRQEIQRELDRFMTEISVPDPIIDD